MSKTEQALLHAKLNQETAKITWNEIAVQFASGLVIAVSSELDLIEVAAAMAKDDTAAVSKWIEQQSVGRVSDLQAQAWAQHNPTLWAVVVKPWILVQPVSPVPTESPAP